MASKSTNNFQDVIVIKSWEQYAHESEPGNRVYQRLAIHTHARPMPKIGNNCKSCIHHRFESESEFIDLIWNWINNDQYALKRFADDAFHSLAKYGAINCNTIYHGICSNCSLKFIVKTKGLYKVFINAKTVADKSVITGSFININIIICNNPIFLRTLLLKSNVKCLALIFNIFFTNILDSDLNTLIHSKNNAPQVKLYAHSKIEISNMCINNCHGFETSFCTVAALIIELIPLLKLHHLKYLFVDNDELSCFISIFEKFMQQIYTGLHYVRFYAPMQQELNINYKSIPKSKFASITGEELPKIWNKLPAIFQHLFQIIGMFYRKFDYYSSQIKGKRLLKKEYQKIINVRDAMFSKIYPHGAENKIAFPKPWSFVAIGLLLAKFCCFKCISKTYSGQMQCEGCKQMQQNVSKKFKVCSGCKLRFYCSRKCQKYDWSRNKHNDICYKLRDSFDV
eukprot:540655_1